MSTEIEIVGYLRASPEGKPEWSEDCVCVDAVYPNYDGDESVSMPICRLADAKAIIDRRDARIGELERDLSLAHMACELAEEELAALKAQQPSAVHLLFDGPPGHECGRFIEAEDPTGKSINAGEWSQRPDGYWQLVIQQPSTGVAGEAVAIAECREVHGHMCQFLNRTQHGMDTLRDGDKLYTAPPATADARLVPVELLELCIEGFDDYWVASPEGIECTSELRALLAQSNGVKP